MYMKYFFNFSLYISLHLPLNKTLLNELVIILSSGLGVSPIWTIKESPTIP